MGVDDDTSSGFGRGALQLAAANGVYVLASYVTTTVLARVLEPSDFGGFGIVMAWITVLTALLVKGLATSVAREMAAAGEHAAAAWRVGRSLGIVLGAALALVGVALSPLLAPLLDADGLADELVIGALGALTFGTNAVLLAWPTGLRRYGRQALAQVAYAFARLALVLGGGVAFGITGAVVGYVLAPLLSSLALLSRVPADHDPARTAVHRGAILRMIAPVALSSMAITAYFVVDVFAVSRALGAGATELGVYAAYGTLAHVPFFLLQATSVAMVPAIVGAATDAARATAIRRTLTDTVVLLAGPTLLLVTAGDAAARVIFGSAYHTSGLVVAPLAVATAALTWMAGLVAVDVALDRMRGALIITGAGAVAVALAAWWGAAHSVDVADTFEHGPASAAAWAAAIVTVFTTILLALRAQVRIGRPVEPTRALLGVLLGTAVSLPAVFVGDDAWRTAAAVALGVVWLAVALRSGLVDVRPAAATPPSSS